MMYRWYLAIRFINLYIKRNMKFEQLEDINVKSYTFISMCTYIAKKDFHVEYMRLLPEFGLMKS